MSARGAKIPRCLPSLGSSWSESVSLLETLTFFFTTLISSIFSLNVNCQYLKSFIESFSNLSISFSLANARELKRINEKRKDENIL